MTPIHTTMQYRQALRRMDALEQLRANALGSLPSVRILNDIMELGAEIDMFEYRVPLMIRRRAAAEHRRAAAFGIDDLVSTRRVDHRDMTALVGGRDSSDGRRS